MNTGMDKHKTKMREYSCLLLEVFSHFLQNSWFTLIKVLCCLFSHPCDKTIRIKRENIRYLKLLSGFYCCDFHGFRRLCFFYKLLFYYLLGVC